LKAVKSALGPNRQDAPAGLAEISFVDSGRELESSMSPRTRNGCRPTVAVVIPTYQRPQHVRLLIESLLEGTMKPDEIVVVDNDPAAPEAADLSVRAFPVRYIRSARGLDLAGARNLGWRACQSDLCVFVDDDNVVEARALEELVLVSQMIGVGMVGPLILRADDTDVIWCGGIRRSMITTRTVFLDRGSRCHDGLNVTETDDMPDALAVPRDVLVALGGFDEARFPFHYDEADLAARIRHRGLRCVVARKSRVYHSGFSGSDPAAEWLRVARLHGGQRARLQARARVYFHRRHSRGWQRVAALTIFIPLWALLTSAACVRAHDEVGPKLTAIYNLLYGLVVGYVS
jgi:GT2 family glycosyltransferase